jgi:catechol 2,3-dioxygenase-like lactoylglutathione lyase family enzyme
VIKSLYHVGISVVDLDRSLAFYGDLFEMDVVVAPKPFSGGIYETIMALEGATGRLAIVQGGSLQLELFEFAHPAPRPSEKDRPVSDHGISHFCIEVADIEREYQRLKAAGVFFHCPPQNHRGVILATYGRDPDGNVFELVQLKNAG